MSLQSLLIKPPIGPRIKEARDLDLAVNNDHANADGSPAWLFKPLLGKCSNTIIIHCLLTSKGSRMQNNGIYVYCCCFSNVAFLQSMDGQLQPGQPIKLMPHCFFSLRYLWRLLDCWGRALSLIGSRALCTCRPYQV